MLTSNVAVTTGTLGTNSYRGNHSWMRDLHQRCRAGGSCIGHSGVEVICITCCLYSMIQMAPFTLNQYGSMSRISTILGELSAWM